MKENTKRINIKKILKYVIGTVLLLFVLNQIDFQEFIKTIKNIRLIFLLILFIYYFIGIIGSTIRWKYILKKLGYLINIRVLFINYLVGNFYNTFLPSSIGGDFVKYVRLSKKVPKKVIMSSIILDRGYGVISGICISTLVYFLWGKDIIDDQYLRIIELLCLLGISIFILFILLNKKIVNLFVLLKRRFNYKIMIKILDFLIFFLGYFPSTKFALIHSFILSIAYSYGSYLAFLAFSIKVNVLEIIMINPIISVISLIPISINALGIKEGAFVYFYRLVGVSNANSIATSFLTRVIMILASLLGVFFI